MEVTTGKAVDPNGEGTFRTVTFSLDDQELLATLTSAYPASGIWSVRMTLPSGYAGQLGGKLLDAVKEAEEDDA